MADRTTFQGSSNEDSSRHEDDAQGNHGRPEGQPQQQLRPNSGFAALVDAFMSSFRQATTAQDQTAAPHAHPGHAIPPPQSGVSSEQAEQERSTSSSTLPIAEQHDRPHTPVSVPPTLSEQGPSPSSSGQVGQASEALNNNEVPPHRENDTSPSEHANQPNHAEESEGEPTARTLYFRMPMFSEAGRTMTTLAFNPGPIPVPPQQPGGAAAAAAPTFGPERPGHLGPERGNGRASGYHLPLAPIFVPLGASPLPFSFIFDTQTNTAWPIAAIATTPPTGSSTDERRTDEPNFIAGPPFHVALNISFGPPPQAEAPDPERAQRFVNSLEKADSELRMRMARLGIGAIGDYGGSQDNEGGEGALGCGICLDEYQKEDVPEWVGGQASKDEEVVAVPCAGHHTLHHRCLYDWLSKTPSSEWTCPFCRAGLDKEKVDSSAGASQQPRQTRENVSSTTTNDDAKRAEEEARARSLREEVRLREKARGWRCDSPACLPRYPIRNDLTTTTITTTFDNASSSNSIVTLLPCRHQLHLDCLCTSIKLERADSPAIEGDAGEEGEEEEDEEEEEEEEEDESSPADNTTTAAPLLVRETVGKWVTCPTCRHEAWAELPMKKRSKRVAAAQARLTKDEQREQLEWRQSHSSVDGAVSSADDHYRQSLGTKRPLDVPSYGVRERTRLQDSSSNQDSDSDGDVEALLC